MQDTEAAESVATSSRVGSDLDAAGKPEAVETQPDNKIDLQTAEREFDRFVNTMDIDIDESHMDEDDLKSFNQMKRRVVNAIADGSLVINDEAEPVYTTQRMKDATVLRFQEPTGANLMAMDRKKKSEDVRKMYALMAEITGSDAKTFSQMPISDLNICTALTSLFLA